MGGVAGQKEGDEGGCVYSNGPRPGIGGEGPPLLTIQWRNYHRHQQASSRTVLLQIGFNDKMQRRRVSKSRNKRLVSCGAIRVWRARDYPTSDWIVNWNSICHPNQPLLRMWLSDPLSVAEWIYDGITWWLVWPAADRVVKCPDDIFTVDCWWSSSNCWSPKAKLHSWNFRIFFSCNKG